MHRAIKYFHAGYYLPFLIICWGLTSTFMGFAKSYAGLIVARCFLGLFEGGLLPGIIVYLAMSVEMFAYPRRWLTENRFYPRHKMAWRIGLFYCAAPLSGAFGGLLATGLAQIRVGGYNKWPWWVSPTPSWLLLTQTGSSSLKELSLQYTASFACFSCHTTQGMPNFWRKKRKCS